MICYQAVHLTGLNRKVLYSERVYLVNKKTFIYFSV